MNVIQEIFACAFVHLYSMPVISSTVNLRACKSSM